MESRVNYTAVGFFVIAIGVGMIAAAFWLTTSGHSRLYRTYVVYMNEAVAGLNEQAPVKFNGVQVGYVANIALNPTNPQQVKLTLAIESITPISTSTIATLASQGITGIAYVGLKATSAEGKPLMAKPEEPYPEIKSQPSLLVELDTAIRDISTRFREISQRISNVLDSDNAQAFRETLANLRTISETLADNNERVDAAIRNADELVENLSKSSRKLPEATRHFQSAMRQVDEASKSFHLTMKQTQSTVQTISQEALPSTLEMIQSIKLAAGNIEQLSGDLARDPSMLVRGRQATPPGPGE